MGTTAEIKRLAVAFGLSVVVHALAVVVAPGWRFESRPAPLVVTMLERGGGAGEGAGAPGAREMAELPAEASAAIAPAPPRPAPAIAPVAPARLVERVPAVRPPPTIRRAPEPVVAEAPPAPGAALDPAVSAAAAAGGASGSGTGETSGGGNGTAGRGGTGGDAVGGDGLRAFCASCPAPEYPGRARRQGWQGVVDVALAIASDGSVREARVERSSGYPTLDDVALDVARRSRFEVPDGGDGLRGQLRYRFVLDATAARR